MRSRKSHNQSDPTKQIKAIIQISSHRAKKSSLAEISAYFVMEIVWPKCHILSCAIFCNILSCVTKYCIRLIWKMSYFVEKISSAQGVMKCNNLETAIFIGFFLSQNAINCIFASFLNFCAVVWLIPFASFWIFVPSCGRALALPTKFM